MLSKSYSTPLSGLFRQFLFFCFCSVCIIRLIQNYQFHLKWPMKIKAQRQKNSNKSISCDNFYQTHSLLDKSRFSLHFTGMMMKNAANYSYSASFHQNRSYKLSWHCYAKWLGTSHTFNMFQCCEFKQICLLIRWTRMRSERTLTSTKWCFMRSIRVTLVTVDLVTT